MSDNIVRIGKKPVMSYIVATMTCLTEHNGHARLLARGRAINTLVDVVESLRHRYLPDIQVKIRIGTDEVPVEDGYRKVSMMEITLETEG